MSFGFRRSFVQILFVAGLVLTSRSAFADSISVGDTLHLLEPGGTIWGGVMYVDDLNILPNYPNDPNPPAYDLATFCIQMMQDINDTDDFKVTYIGKAGDNGSDPLQDQTAWIYTQFRAGALGAYTEDEIQAAMWEIEGDWQFSDADAVFGAILPNLATNAAALKAEADAAVAGGYTNKNVLVLTLEFATGPRAGDPAQDLLMLDDDVHIQSEAPEPASLLLLGTGAAALIRRRIKSRRNA